MEYRSAQDYPDRGQHCSTCCKGGNHIHTDRFAGAGNHQLGAQPVQTRESPLRGLSCRRQSSLELAASRGLNSTVLRETQRGGTEDRTCPCP